MCHHGTYDVTSKEQQLGPGDVHTRNHTSNRETCAPPAPLLKLSVSRAEMVMLILTYRFCKIVRHLWWI